MSWEDYLPEDLQELYEIHDYKHAAAILSKEFPLEFAEICLALRTFRFSKNDILQEGGNESNIPKLFSDTNKFRHGVGFGEVSQSSSTPSGNKKLLVSFPHLLTFFINLSSVGSTQTCDHPP